MLVSLVFQSLPGSEIHGQPDCQQGPGDLEQPGARDGAVRTRDQRHRLLPQLAEFQRDDMSAFRCS